ncbi:MAG: fimbrial biogenesis outer membrane usher protein [Deltaproteobacteria bacterium]|nr:fimbrial biogenesis outer membrane usher protein [Deltaproteobacteria bacterium]
MAFIPNCAAGTLEKKKVYGERIIPCLIVIIAIGLIWSRPANAADNRFETAIVAIKINEVEKGEFFVKLTSDHDFLIKVDDFKAMGFAEPRGQLTELEGNIYVSLKSMRGVIYHYDGSNVYLNLTVDPAFLPQTRVDFDKPHRSDVYYPKDNSFFINYGFDYQTGPDLERESFSTTQQVGIRFSDVLFLSDSIYSDIETNRRFNRLMSSFTYDDRKSFNRIVLGDFYATSGSLGSTLQLGGLSYSKNYDINPYYMKHAGFDYSGYAQLPSEVSVYLDGIRVGAEKISPGGFDLKNIISSGGFHNVEIRMKDAFGRERVIEYPFYFTNSLLKKGFHEYSYNIGFLRKAYAVKDNQYSHLMFTAYHRYGLSHRTTLGFQAEGMRRLLNAGPQITCRLGHFGIIDGSLIGSVGDWDHAGLAGSLAHTYLGKKYNARLFVSRYTKKYENLNTWNSMASLMEKNELEIGAGIGYGNKALGSISVELNHTKKYAGEDRHSLGISYSRSLGKNLSLSASYRFVSHLTHDHQFFAALTYYPGKNVTTSLSYQKDQAGHAEVLQVQKNPPLGEGLSYRASVQRLSNDMANATCFNPYIQYSGPYGIYSAEYWGLYDKDNDNTESYQFSVGGSVVYVGGQFGFSRPVNDSFAIIEVGETPGVLAYFNNHKVGRTDDEGKIVIPNLGAFVDNYIAINDKDIPVNYKLTRVNRYVSPPWRSGTLIKFDAVKIQAFTGFLKIRIADAEEPLEYYEMTIKVPAKEITCQTGSGGEFYFENIPPGFYPVEFVYEDKPRYLMMKVPQSDAIIVDLGDISVEIEDEKK